MSKIMRLLLGLIDMLELIINLTPSGEARNKLTELNIDLYTILRKYNS